MKNLIAEALELSNRYAAKLRQGLEAASLSEADLEQIFKNIRLDSGIYLSAKPQYKLYPDTFHRFCEQYLHADIAQKIWRIQRPYQHQVETILAILKAHDTVLSAGTGSGKTESFLAPIIHYCRQQRSVGVKAVIIYPMNALASDQIRRIGAYTRDTSIRFGIYVGSTPRNQAKGIAKSEFEHQILYRDEMISNPPDILITNYVMLDWMLSRPREYPLFTASAESLRYIILDEVHIYQGTRAAHLRYLLARLKHYCRERPIHIATSATLIDRKGNKAQVENFFRDLFDTPNAATVIRAQTDNSKSVNLAAMPDLHQINFDYELSGQDDSRHAMVLLKTLTGSFREEHRYQKDAKSQSAYFEAMRQNPFYQAINQALFEGAIDFSRLLEIFQELTAWQYSESHVKRCLSAYLDLLAYMDRASVTNEKLLDARVHLFIRDMQGNLRIDLDAGQYLVNNLEFSPDTGNRIFPVDRSDIRFGIAKISGQTISGSLEREAGDVKRIYYVRIGLADTEMPEEDYFRINITADGRIESHAEGKYKIARLQGSHIDQIDGRLLAPSEGLEDYHYIYSVVEMLFEQRRGARKVLAFIDNREQASRYSSIFRDEFASRFLFEFLRFSQGVMAKSYEFDLKRTLVELHQAQEELQVQGLEAEIFANMDLWYWRMIASPERKGGKQQLIRLKREFAESLNELEKEIIEEIFLAERAIAKPVFDAESFNAKHIRFQLWRASDRFALAFQGNSSDHPQYHSVALSDAPNAVYAELLKGRISLIEETILNLVDRGLLCCEETPDHKLHYYLPPENLCFNLEESPYRSYSDLKEKLLLTAAVHSSEIRDEERQIIEKKFQNSEDLHLVVATPTLEMGIDIGNLETVVLLGIPPEPSNYAQRAGRAGRGAKLNALILSFCSSQNPHDMYMFNNPSRIINGEVAPPSFDPRNAKVIAKHIHAYLLRQQRNLNDLRSYRNRLADELDKEFAELEKLFGEHFELKTYLKEQFPQVLDAMIADLEQSDSKTLQKFFYDRAYFPDYFSQEGQIGLISPDTWVAYQNKQQSWFSSDDTLSSRDIEQAFSQFIPNEIVYVAGDIYRISGEGQYKELEDGTKEFDYFLVEREFRFAKQRKERQSYRRETLFKLKEAESVRLGEGILEITLESACRISFRNYGTGLPQREALEQSFPIGYDLARDSLLLRFDKQVCSEMSQISFVAALDRTITDELGFEGDELKLLFYIKNAEDTEDERHIFYDATGNSNLPFRTIYQYFPELIKRAYKRLKDCSCHSDGCYNCLRSYGTQYIDGELSRSAALELCAYLVGQGIYQPHIAAFPQANPHADLILTVEISGDFIQIQSNHGEVVQKVIEGSQNTSVFTGLADVILRDFRPSMQSLQVRSHSLLYVVEGINKSSVNKDKEAFNNLQFILLRFKSIEGKLI